MIIDYSTDSKSYKENILDFRGIFSWGCPSCGALHSLTRHATYVRNLVSLKDEGLQEEKLCILRLKCSSCSHTHAILPFDVVPFYIYSAITILEICAKVLLDGNSPETLSRELPLSYQLVYRFLDLLILFSDPILLFLRQCSLWHNAVNPSAKEVLHLFRRLGNPVLFLGKYLDYHRQPVFLKRCCSSSYPFWTGAGNSF